MANLILMVGNIGAGKTKLSNELADTNTIHLSIDDINATFKKEYGPDYWLKFDRYITNQVVDNIKANKSVILDGTLLTKKDRKNFALIAKHYEAQILCYDFGPGTEAQLLNRIKDSREKSEHEWRQIYSEKRESYEKPTYQETIDKIFEV